MFFIFYIRRNSPLKSDKKFAVIFVIWVSMLEWAINICISILKGYLEHLHGSESEGVSEGGLVIRYLPKTENPQKAFLCYEMTI